jgi:hypothetical protein
MVRFWTFTEDTSMSGRGKEILRRETTFEEVKGDVQRGNLGSVHTVELLLGKVGEEGIPRLDGRRRDTADRFNSLGLLDELSHLLAQSIN